VSTRRGKKRAKKPAVRAPEILSASSSEFDRAEAAAKLIHSQTALRPQIALVLGSGLGAIWGRSAVCE